MKLYDDIADAAPNATFSALGRAVWDETIWRFALAF